MNTHATYTNKAEKYAKYRWDYAPQAIEAIFAIARVSSSSIVADIGAGTGILTRHFAGRVSKVLAVEPNREMRRQAAMRLPVGPGCVVIGGCAEMVPLRDQSLDLITVAQAIHWCEPEQTRREFQRLLRPGGWLALVRNYSAGISAENAAGVTFEQALAEVCTAENGVCEAKAPPPAYKRPEYFFFCGSRCQKLVFPFTYHQDWESFIGALCSTSYMPDEDHPAYLRFEKAVRAVFNHFSHDGLLPGSGETELLIGQIMEH